MNRHYFTCIFSGGFKFSPRFSHCEDVKIRLGTSENLAKDKLWVAFYISPPVIQNLLNQFVEIIKVLFELFWGSICGDVKQKLKYGLDFISWWSLRSSAGTQQQFFFFWFSFSWREQMWWWICCCVCTTETGNMFSAEWNWSDCVVIFFSPPEQPWWFVYLHIQLGASDCGPASSTSGQRLNLCFNLLNTRKLHFPH